MSGPRALAPVAGLHLTCTRHVSYTVKNLRDVEDMAVKYGYSETQEARFAHGDLGAEQTGFSLQSLKPGKRQVCDTMWRTRTSGLPKAGQ